MTQFEVKRGVMGNLAQIPAWGSPKYAPSYAPGGIMAMEGPNATALGMLACEIRRTRPGSTRDVYAKGYVHRAW